MCSLPADVELFRELMASGPQDQLVGLAHVLQDQLTAGMHPLTTVVYDNVFEMDVPADKSFGYMEGRETRGEALTYGFQTTFLNAGTFKEFTSRWSDTLQQRSRRAMRSGIGGTLLNYDCRSGERFVNVYLALDPIAERLSS
jgi:hypothetical protein